MVLVLKKNAGKKEIAAIRKKLESRRTRGVDTRKYLGTVKLKEDPLVLQKKMRDEWS